MDYVTRQLILLLTKTLEKFDATINYIRKDKEQQDKIRQEGIEQILGAYNQTESDRSKNGKRQYDVQNSARWAAWLTFVATTGAFLAAGWYAYITHGMWGEMKEGNRIGRENLTSVQSAFVYLDSLNPKGVFDYKTKKFTGAVFSPTWRNSGKTQAKNMTSWTVEYWEPKGMPNDFQFPNISSWPKGAAKPLEATPEEIYATKTFLPPETTQPPSMMFEKGMPFIANINNRTTHYYIYGWAKYSDVFQGTVQHTTVFCWEITGFGLPTETVQDPSHVGSPFSAHLCQHKVAGYERPVVWHNCFDEQCDNQK